MTPFFQSLCTAPAALLVAGLLAAAPAQAVDSQFSFAGLTDSGALAGQGFAGSFSFDAASINAGFSDSIALSSFSMSFSGQQYTLLSADVPAFAVFSNGSFVGLDFVDIDSADTALRPALVLTAGFQDFNEAFFAYETTAGSGLAGFGSYTVAAVPEPETYALLLAGLGVIGLLGRRRKA